MLAQKIEQCVVVYLNSNPQYTYLNAVNTIRIKVRIT